MDCSFEYAYRVAEGEIGPEEVLEGISVPDVPEDVEDWEDYDGWTAGKVLEGIEAVAKATGEDPDELLAYTADAAKRNIIGRSKQQSKLPRTSKGWIGSACYPGSRSSRR